MAGIGLGGFLGKTPGGGGRKSKFLDWRDKGEIVVWLHCHSPIHYAYQTVFMMEDTFEEEDERTKQKRTKAVLRFPRFISPEKEAVLEEQYFRDKATGLLKNPPRIDPFLLSREWLRGQIEAGIIAPEAPVFEWFDPKNNRNITWRAGIVSKLEKGGKNDFGQSIDPKVVYTLVVCDHDNPGAGLQIAQETRSLGDKLREAIKQQCESRGVTEGDPTLTPYAFKLKYNKNASKPDDYYTAFRFDKAQLYQDVWDNIDATRDVPDVEKYTTPQPGDSEKIRAAFESAMRIDFPLDLIFSTEQADRDAVLRGETGRTVSRSSGQRAAPGGVAPSIPSGTGGASRPMPGSAVRAPAGGAPLANRPGPTTTPQGAQQGTPPVAGRSRVRKEPPPTIPCEDCQHPMAPTDTTCAKCGAQYTVTPDDQEPVQAAQSAPAPTSRPMPIGGSSRPMPTREQPTARDEQPDQESHSSGSGCFACGSSDIDFAMNRCRACGMTQSDPDDADIPF